MAESNAMVRDTSGRFVPGCPPGPGNPQVRRMHAYRTAISAEVTPERLGLLMRRLLKSALEGDSTAAKIVLERALGKPNATPDGQAATLDLPEVLSAKDVVGAASKILTALGSGQIGVDEATKLMLVMETLRRTIETADIEARLAAIERDVDR